jgi:hypothetical protein
MAFVRMAQRIRLCSLDEYNVPFARDCEKKIHEAISTQQGTLFAHSSAVALRGMPETVFLRLLR